MRYHSLDLPASFWPYEIQKNQLPHDFGWPPPFFASRYLLFFPQLLLQNLVFEMHASDPGRNSRRERDLGDPLHPTLQHHDLIGMTGNANTLPVAFHDPSSQRLARSLHDEMQERGRSEVNKSDSTKRKATCSGGSFHPPHRTKKRKALTPIVRIAMLRTKLTYLHLLTEGECRGSIS